MKQRLTISLFGITILLFSICYSHNPLFRPIFTLITAGVICFAQWEYYHIAHGKGYTPLTTLGIIGSIAYVFANFFGVQYPVVSILPQIVLWITLITAFSYYFIKGSDPFNNLAITIFGIIYLTIPLSLVLNITYYFPDDQPQDGRWWLFYLLLITKITDTGAYFIGKKWGVSKMVPYISPKKSWEGAAGGLVTAILTSLVFYYTVGTTFETPPITLTYFGSVWIAASISLLAQFGDLAESLLKRDVGVKDSSQLPGLGGFLDVVDSIIFTCPFLYFVLKLTY
ncbi:MAG: phosphatidate cytidylyltransferase [Chlamydiota bacterium]|nr:phosphatidate cytidylyltransferase [Chlamydiota bacterium]